MTLRADIILRHPALQAAVRQQAATLLAIHEANPRIASVFATQQRWLMAHIALALYFSRPTEDAAGGLIASAFLDAVEEHAVASRNTADAFLKEMLKYGYVESAPSQTDKRRRPLQPAPLSLQTVSAWLVVHLATLDALDGRGRTERFLAQPQSLAGIQPRVSAGLIGSLAIRDPAPTFSLFTWLNEGGIVMDWLIAGLEPALPGQTHIASAVTSFNDLMERLNLSRTHLQRKLRLAEAIGSLGWHGERGRSPMWVSTTFLHEYHCVQAAKLAIIDAAFDAVFEPQAAMAPVPAHA